MKPSKVSRLSKKKKMSFQHGEGCHPLDLAISGLTKPSLELLQGWGVHRFSDQPMPQPYHPLKYFLLTSNLGFPSFSFEAIPSSPITVRPHKKSDPHLLVSSLQVLKGHNKVAPASSPVQAKQDQFL